MRGFMILLANLSVLALPAQNPPTPALGMIQGNVIASDTNAPIGNAAVLLRPLHHDGNAGATIRTNTDEKGDFTLPNLAPGRYILSVEHAAYGRVTYSEGTAMFRGMTFALKPGEAKSVRMRLAPLGKVTGGVAGPDGAPLPGARAVLAHYIRMDGARILAPEREVQADAHGAFAMTGIPAGDYIITAYARGQAMYAPCPPQALHVDLGKTVQAPQLQPVASRGFSVLGRVVDASGNAVAGLALTARRDSLMGYDSMTAKTGASGEFVMARLFPGNYRIDVADANRKLTGYTVADVTQDVRGLVIKTAPGSVVSGKVAFEGNMPGMSVPPDPRMARITLVRDLESSGSPVVIQRAVAEIAADGTFRIDNVPEGPMRFLVSMSTSDHYLKSITQNRRDLTDQALDVRAGEQSGDIEIVISTNAAQLSGKVAIETGGVKPEVLVYPAGMQTPRARERLTRVARVNESGQFTIRGLTPGEYNIVAVRGLPEGVEANPDVQTALEPYSRRMTLTAGKLAAGTLQPLNDIPH